MRVPLVYLPCCPVPNCPGKQGELSGNSLPNLKNSSFCLPVYLQQNLDLHLGSTKLGLGLGIVLGLDLARGQTGGAPKYPSAARIFAAPL